MIGVFLILNIGISLCQSPGSKEDYFEQKLDHFNPNNKDTWKQRYWWDHSHYRENGRAFLFVHGAHTVGNIGYIDSEFIIPLAQSLNATRFYLEHRFYGKSKPKSDTSLESLVYLRSQQALADIEYFIKGMSEQHDFLNGTEWVAIGISYGGTLATWARFKYPKLILSTVAISAPLLAKVDYGEYYENVLNSLNKCNPKCVERIAQANRDLETAIKHEKDRKAVTKMFQLCDDFTDEPDDVSSLFAELAENFAHALDFSGLRTISPKKGCSSTELCNIMLKPDTPALNAYAEVNKRVMAEVNPEQKCFDHRFKNHIEKLNKTDYEDTMKISRQWIYQTCTEFGFLQSSSKTSDIFGNHFPAIFLVKRCQELFGQEFNLATIEKKASNVNRNFGGLDIDVNNTIILYNTEDPWRSLFITNNKTNSYETLGIETIHCPKKLDSIYPGGKMGFFSKILGNVEEKLGCVFNDDVTFIYHTEDPWRTLFVLDNKIASYEVLRIVMPYCVTKLNSWKNSFFKIKIWIEEKFGCNLYAGDKCECQKMGGTQYKDLEEEEPPISKLLIMIF